MDKKSLSERDICTKYITPALLDGTYSHKLEKKFLLLTEKKLLKVKKFGSKQYYLSVLEEETYEVV